MGPLVETFALDMRTHKGANSENRQPMMDAASAVFGPAQLAWLKAALKNSRATWKVIAADLPLGLIVKDGETRFEGVANRDPGAPLGREMEVADLLRYIKQQRIRNVVWITADVHYCAAHEYHPTRARFTDFDPFWEFVAGPLNAGTFGPGELDADVRPRSEVRRHPEGDEGESAAYGRLPVLRNVDGEPQDARDDCQAAQPGRPGDLHPRARAGLTILA